MSVKGRFVTLRAIEREDLVNRWRWYSDPLAVKFYGGFFPRSLEHMRERFEERVDRPDDSAVSFAIAVEGRHVGFCSLAHIDHRNRKAEAPIIVGEPGEWSRGIGTDALRTLVQYGFEELNLHRVYLKVAAPNESAIHCYEKCGFKHEGRLRNDGFLGGRPIDTFVMSILEDECRRDSESV